MDAALSSRAPGVVWQDVFVPPPPRFLTGVPAFLGYATGTGQPGEDRFDEPLLLTLWPHFEQLLGPAPDRGYLAPAVRGFFENRGLLCYVVRLRDDPTDPEHALARGLESLAAFEPVDLVCAPDIMRGLDDPGPGAVAQVAAHQQLLLDHCRQRGDRFAILDALNAGPDAVLEQRAALREAAQGALYHPWLVVPSPAGSPVTVPPCGHVAGVYSRTDQVVGVHKAPANAALEGVLDLRHPPAEREVAQLTALGVNAIRAFPGRGIRVWGSRSLGQDQDPVANQVNVRRLLGTVARWVEQFMASVTFEANDLQLWLRIMREISAYCEDLFRRGALKGRVAEEAFYVKCDSDTNPPEVIRAGMVVTELGLAPIAPAEFITVRIIHGENGVSLSPVGAGA